MYACIEKYLDICFLSLGINTHKYTPLVENFTRNKFNFHNKHVHVTVNCKIEKNIHTNKREFFSIDYTLKYQQSYIHTFVQTYLVEMCYTRNTNSHMCK
jgi:hypothetical protein